MQLTSALTCPKCGGVATETMPTNACQFFYDCRHCAVVLRPCREIAVCSARSATYRARRYRMRTRMEVRQSAAKAKP
jgi:hypothetical protein